LGIAGVDQLYGFRERSADDAQLTQTLAGLAAQKRAVNTPAQIVRELPNAIPLPAPIELQYATESKPPASQNPGKPNPNPSTPTTNEAKPVQAVIPAEDLKPLYDFALDCKACQAKLIATQSDLSDEKTKAVALTHERDDALRVARGGSVWQRIGRAAKWFAIGAAAGAIAAKASH
jgi:hypothetical protein